MSAGPHVTRGLAAWPGRGHPRNVRREPPDAALRRPRGLRRRAKASASRAVRTTFRIFSTSNLGARRARRLPCSCSQSRASPLPTPWWGGVGVVTSILLPATRQGRTQFLPPTVHMAAHGAGRYPQHRSYLAVFITSGVQAHYLTATFGQPRDGAPDAAKIDFGCVPALVLPLHHPLGVRTTKGNSRRLCRRRQT